MSKKPDWFKGIFPALVTPFTKDDEIDEAAYRALIRYVLPHVDGVVPVGTTGEFVYLSEAEKQKVIEVAIDEVGGGVPVVAGTAAPAPATPCGSRPGPKMLERRQPWWSLPFTLNPPSTRSTNTSRR